MGGGWGVCQSTNSALSWACDLMIKPDLTVKPVVYVETCSLTMIKPLVWWWNLWCSDEICGVVMKPVGWWWNLWCGDETCDLMMKPACCRKKTAGLLLEKKSGLSHSHASSPCLNSEYLHVVLSFSNCVLFSCFVTVSTCELLCSFATCVLFCFLWQWVPASYSVVLQPVYYFVSLW